MTPHLHSQHVPGCYRCDLTLDEIDPCSCGDPTRRHINHRKTIPCWTYIGTERHDIGQDGRIVFAKDRA